ncbi:MAG: FKBP-type peptidyl-prolyl cis-trans isomerase N-terminal domain-containing protein [Luteimonas sp.]
MRIAMRGLLALCLAAAALSTAGAAAQQQVLASERDRVSYMVGMDLGQSLEPVGPDIDHDALARSIASVFQGEEPLLDEATAQATGQAMSLRAAFRSGQPMQGMPPGASPPDVDPQQVGLLLGLQVGQSLLPLREEIELPVVLQALRTRVDGGEPLMTAAEASELRTAFAAQAQQRMQAEAAQLGERNRAEGAAFLAGNRDEPGVITTPSGLQYKVIRDGSGQRPLPRSRVRVHYHGTLLDGTVFDSSYDRNQPAEFSLGQVIPGWTEGVALMPVGAKYRFWIPGQLGYGASGTSGGPIGPNATLVFDIELLDVL